ACCCPSRNLVRTPGCPARTGSALPPSLRPSRASAIRPAWHLPTCTRRPAIRPARAPPAFVNPCACVSPLRLLCDAPGTEGRLGAVAPKRSRIGQAARFVLGGRLDQVLESAQVGQRLATRDPPIPFPPDRLGEPELQQRVEVTVGGLQNLPEQAVQLFLGDRLVREP